MTTATDNGYIATMDIVGAETPNLLAVTHPLSTTIAAKITYFILNVFDFISLQSL